MCKLTSVLKVSLVSLALTSASSAALAASGTAAVVYNSGFKEYSDGLAGRLVNAGYAVTEVTSISALGDMSSFDQIWDFDIYNNLSVSDQNSYLDYIQGSKGIFLLGENSGWQNRNQSIVDFIKLAGGGDLSLSTSDYTKQYVTSGFNGAGIVAPDSATPLVYNYGAAFTTIGSGYLIATTGPDGTGYGTGIAFGSGSLANAPTGRIMSFLDINMFRESEWSTYGMALMDRMIAFSAGAFQADPDLPGSGTPPPASPTVIDNSQASFDLSSTAAQQPVISFDGGQLDMTGGGGSNPTVDRNIDILAGGGFINTAGVASTVNGRIGGVGGLFVIGGGSLALTQANSYEGGTAVDGASLILAAPGALSTGGVQMINGTLVLRQGQALANGFNVSGDNAIVTEQGITTLSGDMSGTGALTFLGNANFTGSSTHSGQTSISGGRLAVNGSMRNSTVVATAGSMVGGNGVVGGMIVRSQATAAPGNSIGTLDVAGTLLFEAGSVYEVEVNAAGENDRINATGLVTIEGGSVAVLAGNGNYRPSTDYTIIASDTGVEGAFTPGAITSNLAFLDPSLSYSANAVILTLTRNDLAFADAAATRNQHASATAIESSFGFGSAVFDGFVGASEDQARRGFDSLSGEINASALSVAATDATALVRSLSRRTDDAPVAGSRLWTELAAGRTNFDDNGNAAAVRANARGFVVGFETGNDNVVLGVAGGYTDTNARLDDRAARADVKSVHGAAYAKGSFDAVRLRGGAAYTDLKIDTERTAAIGAVSNALSARIDGRAIQAFGEAGYALPLGLGSIEPFAGINALWLRNKAFVERGGTLALAGSARSHDQVWSTLGLKTAFALGATSPVSVHAKAGWQHALNNKAMISRLAFASGGAPFVAEGTPLARNAVLLDTRVQWQLTDRLGVSAGYAGSLANQGTVHSGQAAVSFRF